MKKIKITLAIVCSLLMISANAQKMEPMKSMTPMNENNSMAQNTGTEFQRQLGLVVVAAGELSAAFLAEDAVKVTGSLKKIIEAINDADMRLLSGKEHMAWMKYKDALDQQTEAILSSHTMSRQREIFAALNNTLHECIGELGIRNIISYYQYCPMALNSKGAFWFSNSKDIKNPYLGLQMSGCGSTKEVFQ